MPFEQLIERGFKTKHFIKDCIIYEPGSNARFVYFIVSGEVRMVTRSREGKEFTQGVFKSGQYFGEPALIVGKPYLAYTIANVDCDLILMNKSDFFQMIKQDAEFSMHLIQALSNRLFYKSMMLEEMASENADHRLLTLIKYLFNDVPVGEHLKVTRQELAYMSGLRVETVIRSVKFLAKSGAIRLSKGKIFLS